MSTGRIRLFLVRHGEVDTGPTASYCYYGFTDVCLSAKGREQMEKLSERLEKERFSEAYSSDLKRALEGAQIIARPHALEVKTFPAFREINLGILEGLPFEEAQRLYPESAAKSYRDVLDYRIPDGENIRDVKDRVLPAFKGILEVGSTVHPPAPREMGSSDPPTADAQDRKILLVAHNTVNRVILADALGLPLEGVFALHQNYGCLNIIDFRPEGTIVRLMNG